MNRGALKWILLSLAIAGTANAQKRKAKKGNDLVTSEKKAANVLKPDSDDKELSSLQDAELDKLVADKEARLSKVRMRQIEKMRAILRKNPLYRNKADLLFRIAEREWDEAKYRYFLERRKYDQKYEAYLNGTLKAKPKEPEADYSKALSEYDKLMKEFPNYRRIDEVMFYLGRGQTTAGKKKQGASTMMRLSQEYPKSRFYSRAILAVAEYYFDNDLLFAAKKNYLKVIEDTKSQQYPYALYKLGYVYYNLKEYEDSIKSFKGVVKLSKGKDKRKIYFTNQAYSAMTLSFAEVPDGWKRARDYFREQGGNELATTRLESIARIYNKQDKTGEEIAVYEYLIGADKNGKKIPEYAGYITASYKKQEDMDKVESTINRFVTRFDPKGSWYAVNSQYEEPKIRADQYREEQVDFLIGTYHTKAQEVEKLRRVEQADKLYRKAAKYYEKYIALFPESKDLYEKEFFLAEIYYFQMKAWEKAAQHYGRVVEIDKKGKYSVESAYAVILARQEKMADAGLIKRSAKTKPRKGKKGRAKIQKAKVQYVKRKKGDSFKPIEKKPIAPLQKDFLGACTDYITWYPKDKRVPEVSFLSAEIFMKNGHYADGIKSLEVIMESHPKHRFAGFAAASLFDANYRLKRWDQMERWGRYMLKRRNFKVLSKKKLLDVIAISINEYAIELSGKGEKDKAAKQFLRFVKEFPRHEKAVIALNNAAVITEEAERTEDAIDLYESIIKRYPKSEQATKAHMTLGLLYESQTDFERAARYFEKMASFPDVPEMADALYNAGSIRAALEQYDKAIKIFETFAKKFPKNKDTAPLVIRIAEFHEKKKRPKKTLKVYDRYLKMTKNTKPEMAPEIHLRKAQVYQKIGGRNARRNASAELAKADKAYKRLKGDKKTQPTVRRTMGVVRFLQAEYVYDDFEAIKLKFPIYTLKKLLVKKAKILTKSEKLFFEVADYKSWQVTAGAFYRIGESYYLYAQSLFDLPLPKGLSEDEIDIYRAELDDKAAPLQEKAIEATKNALKLAHKHHVYNEWSRKAATLLVKLSPELFPVLNDAVVNTEWTVPATFSTTFIADPAGTLKQAVVKKPKVKAATTGMKGTKAGADAKATAKDAGASKKKAPAKGKPTQTKKPSSKKGAK